MRELFFTIFALTFLLATPARAQVGDPARADTSTLQQQFDGMLRVSRRADQHKVVRETYLEAFMRNVSDSITVYTDDIAELNSTISTQAGKIQDQTTVIAERDGAITGLEEENKSVNLLGMQVSKATYSTIMWATILTLLAMLVFTVSRMRSAIAASKRAKVRVAKMTEELEAGKRQRLKIEQSLRRQLQDEINKRG